MAAKVYGEAVVYRADGPSAAARQGAVACLIRSVGGADYRLAHTGQTDYAKDAPKIPAGAVTAEDADLIADLVRQGPVRMKLVLTPQTLPDVESANVIGDIKGSEHPEQVIIVSGHLDSWDLGTGAIDDGAGVAVSMEAANLIQKLHLKPKRTIRVIAWMNEENGLAGLKQYERDHEKEWMNHSAVDPDRRWRRSSAWHQYQSKTRSEKDVRTGRSSLAGVRRGHAQPRSNIVAPTLARWKKPACLLSVRFKTVVSIPIITTVPLTRWTRLSRKNWRRIPPSSQSSRMHLQTWSNRCHVDERGWEQRSPVRCFDQRCFRLRSSLSAKLAARRPRLRTNRHGPASTK